LQERECVCVYVSSLNSQKLTKIINIEALLIYYWD